MKIVLETKAAWVHAQGMKINKELVAVVKSLGFASVEAFKEYMKSKAKDHGYDSFGHVEKRSGLELSYWTHCKRQFGIGGNLGGMFCDNRFN